jgi:hypothetical protein
MAEKQTMYAIVRDATYDPTRLAQGTAQLDEFDAIHASQPGYRGSIVVDVGHGRRLSVNVWEAAAAAQATLPTMVPEVERLVNPLLTEPATLVGEGPVVTADLAKV